MRAPLLTIRSYYSLLQAPVSIARWCQAALEYGYETVALADINSLAGAVEFFKVAHALGLAPILGAELLTDTEQLTLLVENEAGYRSLCRLISARNLDPDFQLIEAVRLDHEGLFCLCQQSDLLAQLRPIFGQDRLFAPVQLKAGADPIAWAHFSYLTDLDVSVSDILNKVRELGTQALPGAQGSVRLVPERQWTRQFAACPEALAYAKGLVRRCDFNLLDRGLIFPRSQLASASDGSRELARRCHRGLARRYGTVSQAGVRRLEAELNVIRAQGFSDYFLVVLEIVNFAKQHKIPMEVRGSAAGSLVSYVLGFTRVCPLENHLYFERFLNPGRTDCPDIDIDLCWRRRDQVIRFCYEHWGQDHVAMVCNINRFRRRGAVRDVARAWGYSPQQVDQIAKQGKRDSAVHQWAEKLNGIPRHLGVHCGGIIMTPEPVARFAPLAWSTKGVIITQYDKRAVEPAGLVKIDLLSNRALSTVHDALGLIGPDTLDIEAPDLTADARTAQLLSRGDSLGVFQSESPGMRQLVRALKVKNQKELAIALSLIRPGPAAGGMKTEFIARHVQGKAFRYLHPRLKDLLGDTYGVMLYQEDVMRIAVELAGYTVAEADRFRSEVSKKVSGTRLQAQYTDFVYGRAEQTGLDRESAERIWDQILQFGAYSYCKAHATVYAHIAWQTALLKAHYPSAFYCSLLNNHHGMYPLRVYVWDAKRHGVSILTPHVNHSELEWVIEGKRLRAGLGLIKGMAHNGMQAIIRERARRPFKDLDDLRQRVHLHRGQLEPLVYVGACDGLGPSRPAMLEQLRFPVPDPHQALLFDPYGPGAQHTEFNRLEKLQAEIDLTGIPFTYHPELLLRNKHIPCTRLGKFVNTSVTIAGFIATARRAQTQDKRVMGFVTLEDATGLAEVSFFPDHLDLYQRIATYGGPVWIQGKVTEHLSSLTIECSNCGQAA